MKKQFVLLVCGLIFLVNLPACLWNDHDTSITISDSEDEYRMSASYEENKARKIHRFLRKNFEENSIHSFKNREVDAMITLDDRTKFYVVSYPGELEIKFDKTENSDKAYFKMKEICEDLKDLLEEN